MTDYIIREAAISQILSDPTDAHYPSWYAEKLKQIPAADVRPVVRGKWIRRSDDSCVATCSVCGNENHYAFCIMSLDEQSLVQQDMFCPFCCADMREPNLDTTKVERRDESSG